jgi:O-antigen ligase
LDSVTSTFINRNSYATYAGIGLVCAMTAALSEYARQTARAGRSSLRRGAAFLAATAGPAGAWLACSFVLALALVQTGSRGGITASLAGVIILAVLVLMRGHSVRAGMTVLLALIVAGIALFAFGDFFAARLSTQGFDATDRLAVYWLTILSILDAPWIGFGYGTFKSVFPMYRDRSVGVVGTWDKAHDTYLEIIQGMGIPLALLFLSVLLYLVFRCARAALARQSSATAPLVATGVTVIVAFHAFVDFSMQMQAVALTWTALIGAAVAQSWSGSIETSAPENLGPPSRSRR